MRPPSPATLPPTLLAPGRDPTYPPLHGLGYNPASSPSLPPPPPHHPLPFPARRLARASWARGYLSLCGVAVEGEPALLCSFLPLPSSPYRGWATCGLGRVGRGAVPAGPFAEGPPPPPSPLSRLPPGCLRVGPGGDVTLPLA